MSLTKTDLITKLNEQAGLSKKECASAVDSTFDIIKAELESGSTAKKVIPPEYLPYLQYTSDDRKPVVSKVAYRSSPVL